MGGTPGSLNERGGTDVCICPGRRYLTSLDGLGDPYEPGKDRMCQGCIDLRAKGITARLPKTGRYTCPRCHRVTEYVGMLDACCWCSNATNQKQSGGSDR